MDIAIAHEDYYERGGGEVVAESLAETFDAPIYTGFVNDGVETKADEVIDLFGGPITTKLLSQSFALQDAYYQFAWQHVEDLYDYEVVIQSGNNPGWWVPKDEQIIVKYCHTTPRTPYDLFYERGTNLFTQLYSYASRVLYSPNKHYPDVYVANSESVKRRIERFFGIDSSRIEVVYPPVDVSGYNSRSMDERDDFYFTFSRLDPNKRIGEIVEAFNELDAELVIGGSGKQEDELRAMADDNIRFEGYLSEAEKIDLLSRAKGFIFNARNEDFGLVPVESFAAGLPVLGIKDGFTKYQVLDGVNGLHHDGSPTGIQEAVARYESEGVSWSCDRISEFGRTHFSEEQFQEGMKDAVEKAKEYAEIEPSFMDEVEVDVDPVGLYRVTER